MDPLVSCVIAAEDATASDDMDRDVAMKAATAALRSLPAAWSASRSANALFAVGELATPMCEIVRAALACARLAEDACPSADPDVADSVDVLTAWLTGEASDEERSANVTVLGKRYNGRPSSEVPPAAWAVYCASCVGLSDSASAWYHAHAAAGCAEDALRRVGRVEPEDTVAREVRRFLSCPSVERLAIAIVDENFSLP